MGFAGQRPGAKHLNKRLAGKRIYSSSGRGLGQDNAGNQYAEAWNPHFWKKAAK